MLAAGKLIGFVPTKDARHSREFYEGKLGFKFISDDQFALVMQAGENMIRIARARDFSPAQYTVMGWEVTDIEANVKWLNGRGVVFEKYPFVQDRELGNLDHAQRRQSGLGSRTLTAMCSPLASTRAEVGKMQ